MQQCGSSKSTFLGTPQYSSKIVPAYVVPYAVGMPLALYRVARSSGEGASNDLCALLVVSLDTGQRDAGHSAVYTMYGCIR